MGQPAAGYLIEALNKRASEEDCLTELLACVLAQDREFSQEMLALAELTGYEVGGVTTQVATGKGLCTADMCLSLHGPGHRRAHLWSEHKLDSPFGKDQLRNYECAVRKREARGERIHFLAVVKHLETLKADEKKILSRLGTVRTWSEVADAIDRVQTGRQHDWYQAARKRGASAQLRVLTELAVYLEENVGVPVSGPLDDKKLSALENIQAARKIAEALLELVADRLSHEAERAFLPGEPDERWLWLKSIGWWNEFDYAGMYLWIGPVDLFEVPPDPVPTLGLAADIPEEKDRNGLASDERFLTAVEAESLRIAPYGNKTMLVGDSTQLAAVADRPGLKDQADELEKFVRDAIRRLARCVPTGADARALPGNPKSALDPATLATGALPR